MKITHLEFNNRKKCFELRTGKRVFSFPYAKARPSPDADKPVVRAFADPELGGEAFTYV